jgi:predicted short-subunit dehydrogenase-like oxidoreductase (DUF2520 family)
MNDSPAARAIAVVGDGRLGRVLAVAFGAPAPLRRGQPVPDEAAVVILAVPDGAIAALAASIEPGPAVGHCSGASTLEALAPHDERFSLHPLMTLTEQSGPADLAGAGAAVAGSTPEALALARSLAARAGLEPFTLAESDRALYHAAASVASNFLVTIETIAERLFAAVGVERRHAAVLARASLENWAALGGARALSGPIARGDAETVERQRRAVGERAPDLLPAFDALVDATATLAASA